MTAADLVLPAAKFPGIASVDTVVVLVDDGTAAPSADVADLRAARMTSAGRFVYHLQPPRAGVLKVHVMLFVDEAAARDNWQGRHQPQALAATRDLAAGDEAWIQDGQMAGVRTGRAIVEVRARGPQAPLAEFMQASAAHAALALHD